METAPWGHRMQLPGHHLARWLVAKGHTVAYVSAPVSPWHFLQRSRREDVRKRWNQEGAVGRWRHPRLFTYVPRTWLPVHHRFPFDSNSTWNGSELFTRPRAGEILREAGFERVDFLIMHNLQLPHLVRQLQPKVFVARVEDDIAGFPEMPRVIVRREHEILADADLVTITAEGLRKKVQRAGAERIHLMPNGVETKRFARPAELPPRPADLPKGPVAIYVGALDNWFHEELLAATARRMKDWSFVLIGPPRAPMAELRKMPNVHFLGPRPQEEVPRYLWHATAGIIPFQRTPLIETVCPLKLFEYAAAGLPVLATRWQEIERIGGPVSLSDDANAFCEALTASARSGDSEQRARVKWARSHDWDQIFGRFFDELMGVREGIEKEVAAALR